MNEVLEFIQDFKKENPVVIEKLFFEGYCYYFSVILIERFGGEMWYLEIANHFITKIDGQFYDIKGLVILPEKPALWTDFKVLDESHTRRIIRDCIKKKRRE